MTLSSISTVSSNIHHNIVNLPVTIYLIGSGDATDSDLNKRVMAYSYDISNNGWTTTPDASRSRIHLSVREFATDGNIVLSAGVRNNQSGFVTLAYSTNKGLTWTNSSGSNFLAWAHSVTAYNSNYDPSYNDYTSATAPKKFVAIGRNSSTTTDYASISWSDNGMAWSKTGITSNVFERGRGITYGNGKFVGVGEGLMKIATSVNGVNWIQATTPNIFSVRGWYVAFNGSMFVAVGDGSVNDVATSLDGSTWTPRGRIFKPTTLGGTSLGYNVKWSEYHQKWIAIGWPDSVATPELASIKTSHDGITWTDTGQITLDGNIFNMIQQPLTIECKNEIIMIGGFKRDTFYTSGNTSTPNPPDSSSLIISTDATTWNYITNVNDVVIGKQVSAMIIL